MATIRPNALPAASAVASSDSLVVDRGSAVEKATPTQVVDAAIPLASQSEAETGSDNTKRMTPLRVKQAMDANMATTDALASTDAGKGAALSGWKQAVASAIDRDVDEKLLEAPASAEDVGATADGATDDRTPLQAVLDEAAGEVRAFAGTYSTSAGAVNPNPAVSDPEPSALVIAESGTVIDGQGTGQIEVDTADKTIFHVRNATEANRPTGVVIRDFRRLTQPYGSPELSGLNDDYAVIRLEATRDCRVESIHIDQCEIGFSDQFAQTVGYTDRTSRRNIVHGFTIAKCGFMGFQLFGCRNGSYTGLSAYGEDSDGASRAAAHGLRLIGNSFSVCEGNAAAGVFWRFLNGLSIQNYATGNQVEVRAFDCVNGANVVRSADAGGAARHNAVRLIAAGGDYGLYDDGGSYNTFDVDILDAGTRGINATDGGGIAGLATGNTYRGKVRKTTTGGTARLAQLDGAQTKIDLDLEGSGTTASDTAFGLLSNGDGLTGRVRARNCQIGVQIGGDDGQIDVTASSCGTDLAVTGNGNVVVANCAGNVSVSGDNNLIVVKAAGNVTLTAAATGNVIMGDVAGTVTDSGTGNRRMVQQQTGWTAGTGAANKGAYAAYAGQTISGTYSQAEAQAVANAARDAAQRTLALEQALRALGLIN